MTDGGKKILIVEDDSAIAEIERDYLEIDGFAVEIAGDGHTGIQRGGSGEFNLILLDVMLPGADGFAVCRKLRESVDVPILMVTARREDIDKIRGLGLGADDYIVKPFSPGELVARVKANLAQYERLRSRGGFEPGGGELSELKAGPISIRPQSRRVYVQGRELTLKNKEYELLLFLVEHLDMVLSKETLYEKIWGYDAVGDSATVAVHINRLRDKIEDNPGDPKYIQTVWGAGYRFKA
ncbi:response regulator transcription factor [Saccharibacillus sp. CPCC 101409]|uniref:response regulator transcription factor n=1 Tax=Saccharibacillus sp. CPCC 101409 TaxID=3058041 RepID=UPI002673F9D8|nr:response regulator transcription factor [Saccharibacillus sp. CPCC 101409]MDO3410276.1 response regulator transcription factor [Saccharibacillus sp. CPCC 101409]